MADTMASAAEPAPPAAPDLPTQTYYECGAGRKTFFSFAFVLLLLRVGQSHGSTSAAPSPELSRALRCAGSCRENMGHVVFTCDESTM